MMLVSWALKIAEAPKTDSEFWKTLVDGGYDIQFGTCVPEHILKGSHEGEVRGWNELLCWPVYAVSPPLPLPPRVPRCGLLAGKEQSPRLDSISYGNHKN
ncbi:hypothetical protein F0562_011094 [Nyssa sinensis]|uniref:Uncharacterized protein n=1 Tax=Nyssa sinensis TaxID=561372 RepID=A0A5J5A5H4_9ASTE|nr:hypothetical protein F0562_011094 [Nyssa sinensis]